MLKLALGEGYILYKARAAWRSTPTVTVTKVKNCFILTLGKGLINRIWEMMLSLLVSSILHYRTGQTLLQLPPAWFLAWNPLIREESSLLKVAQALSLLPPTPPIPLYAGVICPIAGAGNYLGQRATN